MEHVKSKVLVYLSEDYKLFRMVDGNRPINKTKVNRIINDIKEGNDILAEAPILVKESGRYLDILDGQHRFEVSKKLGRPVHYIVKKDDMNLYAVAKVNSNTEKWKSLDFINAYIKAGNKNYDQILKFHKAYGISITTCLDMLTHGISKRSGGSHELTSSFQQGSFVVKKYKEAVQLAEICKAFEKFSGWNSRAFIKAIAIILEKDMCDFEKLTKKFNSDPEALKDQPNHKGYLSNLEDIYNKNNSKRQTIY